MEMHNLGKSHPTGSLVGSTESPPSKSYPCLYGLDSEQLPGLDTYNPGDEITLHLTGVVKSKSITDVEGKKGEDVSIEFTQGAIIHDSSRKMAEETGMSVEQVKARKAKYS